MTHALPTHAPDASVLIALNRLKQSPHNARKSPHAKADIEALAASIHAKGLLQNLVVEPEHDESGAATGNYFVQIGEGRRQAQLLRVRRKQIDADAPVRCIIDTGNNPLETSLDENVTRSAMPVMDEVEAFAALAQAGMSVEVIAGRFGASVRLIEQRLALARLSPKIRSAYRKGLLNLDAARAFAINDDHAAQERVFRQLAKPITHAASVRNALTIGRVPADDRLARCVGAAAYIAAGGRISRDLFETDIAFFDDGALLQRLAGEQLEQTRATLLREGWGWTEALIGHGQVPGCASERLRPASRKLKAAEKSQIAALEARIDTLDAQLDDADNDNPLWAQRDALDAQLETLRQSALVFDKKLMVHAGAAVHIDRDGRLVIARGLIKRTDLKTVAKLQKSSSKDGGPKNGCAPKPQQETSPFTKALTNQLTAARTRGVRASLSNNPAVALALLVCAMVRQSAAQAPTPGLGLQSRPIDFGDDGVFATARVDHAQLGEADACTFFDVCLGTPVEALLRTLAMFIAETIDLSHDGASAEDARLQRMSDALAAALDLDMRGHWQADEAFWTAAPKAVVLTALKDASSIANLPEAQRDEKLATLQKLKRADLAGAAVAAMQGVSWLPDLLVTPPRAGAFAVTPAGAQALAATDAEAV